MFVLLHRCNIFTLLNTTFLWLGCTFNADVFVLINLGSFFSLTQSYVFIVWQHHCLLYTIQKVTLCGNTAFIIYNVSLTPP